jgi:opacity protein-like surface antigen
MQIRLQRIAKFGTLYISKAVSGTASYLNIVIHMVCTQLKFLTVLVIALCFSLCSSIAQAQTSRIYFAGYMGLNSMPDNDFSDKTSGESGTYKTNNALSFAGAIGVRLDRRTRIEAEINYSKNDLSTFAGNTLSYTSGGEISNIAALLNGYYDFEQVKWKAKPFLTAGLGVMRFNTKIKPSGTLTEAEETSYALGWQVGGGLKYRVNPGMAITGAYRLLGSTDFGVGAYDINYQAHEFRVGLEYDLHQKAK